MNIQKLVADLIDQESNGTPVTKWFVENCKELTEQQLAKIVATYFHDIEDDDGDFLRLKEIEADTFNEFIDGVKKLGKSPIKFWKELVKLFTKLFFGKNSVVEAALYFVEMFAKHKNSKIIENATAEIISEAPKLWYSAGLDDQNKNFVTELFHKDTKDQFAKFVVTNESKSIDIANYLLG